ncbi:hypothetical protein ACN6K9_006854 [Streptomyces sp. SAS_267]|uniref:hypothetical protein n=1 Tax=Streptomyces sp. SAS_267 TaxID=3412750 RepID=UPI00403CEA7C
MAQIADREAQMEHDLIATYDQSELDFSPVPKQEANPAHQTSAPHPTSASCRRSRGR